MPVTRRRFLHTLAATAAAGPFLHLPARAADRTIRHASFGAAGQAGYDISQFAKHPAFELVAVADVDLCRLDRVLQQFPRVRVYQDWRDLLKKEARNLDSVNISTPDHMHAVQAMEAMKRGLPVYVQKPLTSTLHETRVLTEYARQRGLVTQMGIQVSSQPVQLRGEAIVRSGVVGRIREVHTFSNKSWGEEAAVESGADTVPPTLDWDEWLGVADPRPFKRGAYHPGNWRKRIDFGTGTLGDMGCHIFSPPYRALELGAPLRVTAKGPAPANGNWAVRATVHLVFPGTKYTAGDTIDVWWYDGGDLPPDEVRERAGGKLPDQGSVIIGTEGVIVLPHGATPPTILPEARAASLQLPELPQRDHYLEFIDAVAAGGSARCSAGFDYAGPLTEAVLIGNVAARFPGETLELDAKALRFTNKPEADAYLSREYRKGWRVKELTD